MRFLSLLVAVVFVLTGCGGTDAEVSDLGTEARATSGTTGLENFRFPDEFRLPEHMDMDDVAAIRAQRDRWAAAFAEGDTEILDFVFERDAVTSLPDDIVALSGEEFFATYDAEMSFNESSEMYITDGGDPRTMEKLPWVSFYGDYELTMTPKAGGAPVEHTGRLMTRFRRQQDGTLEIARAPSIGDPAPLFALNDMKGGGEVQLANLIGEKPTVLIFGSFT